MTAPTALIVDDNYFNRDLCVIALKHVGYSVVQAENGVEALNILAEQSFDLLILDLAMPELDGVGVIRALHSQAAHQNMAVIVMTANHHMATDEVHDHVDFVIYKPIDVKEFAYLAQRMAQKSY